MKRQWVLNQVARSIEKTRRLDFHRRPCVCMKRPRAALGQSCGACGRGRLEFLMLCCSSPGPCGHAWTLSLLFPHLDLPHSVGQAWPSPSSLRLRRACRVHLEKYMLVYKICTHLKSPKRLAAKVSLAHLRSQSQAQCHVVRRARCTLDHTSDDRVLTRSGCRMSRSSIREPEFPRWAS